MRALGSSVRVEVVGVWFMLRWIGPRGWVIAGAISLLTLLLIGVVAAIINNPFFIRMTPVRTQDYLIWVATAPLVGLIAGSFVAPVPAGGQGKAIGGGLFSFLAVGCPICNKVVVLLLGISGALTLFAPAQLYIGIASLMLLGWALRQRVRAVAGSCQLSPR